MGLFSKKKKKEQQAQTSTTSTTNVNNNNNLDDFMFNNPPPLLDTNPQVYKKTNTQVIKNTPKTEGDKTEFNNLAQEQQSQMPQNLDQYFDSTSGKTILNGEGKEGIAIEIEKKLKELDNSEARKSYNKSLSNFADSIIEDLQSSMKNTQKTGENEAEFDFNKWIQEQSAKKHSSHEDDHTM